MKNTILKLSGIAFACAVVAIGTASVARADERIVAKVPFEFIVGDVRLPAGDYVVTEMPDLSGVVGVESAHGRRFVATMTVAAASTSIPTSHPELVFEKFDNHYFLARVVPQDGTERDLVLTPSEMEREIVKTSDHGKK